MTVVKITDSSGTQHDILSSKTMGLIRATKESTSTSTNFVLTAPGITELYDGLTIFFKNDATASAADIVFDLNNLGEKQIWNADRNSRVSTVIRANGEYIYVFDYANDRWVMNTGFYADNTNTIAEYSGSLIADTGGIKKNTLVMQSSFNPDKYTSIVNQSASTSTSKTKQTCGFIPNGRIVYYNDEDVTSGNYSVSSKGWITVSVNLRYSFNISTSTLPASVIGGPIYIKCTMSNGLLYLADTWWAYELPSTTDGFYYIYVGQMSTRYTCILHPNHPIYYYDGTQIREYTMETNKLATDISELTEEVSALQLGFWLDDNGCLCQG